MKKRLEHDLLGDKGVPHDAYYGIQTLRSHENFDITNVTQENQTKITIFLKNDVTILSQMITDAHIFVKSYISFS